MVVCSHVNCQLLESFQIEVRVAEDLGRRFAKKFDRSLDQVVIRAVGGTGFAQINRDRPKPFVWIGLHLPPVFQYGDRAIADEVVQPVERAADDPLAAHPRGPPVRARL